MDDLLLFTPSQKVHMSKLEDLLKALLKNKLRISPKSVCYLKQNCNTSPKHVLPGIAKTIKIHIWFDQER